MYEQTDRPIKLTTPLGANALLLVGLQGREAISQLFHFELKTAWNDKTKLLPFDQLLGKKITVEISPSEIQALLQRHRLQSEPGRSGRELHLLQSRSGAATLAARS